MREAVSRLACMPGRLCRPRAKRRFVCRSPGGPGGRSPQAAPAGAELLPPGGRHGKTNRPPRRWSAAERRRSDTHRPSRPRGEPPAGRPPAREPDGGRGGSQPGQAPGGGPQAARAGQGFRAPGPREGDRNPNKGRRATRPGDRPANRRCPAQRPRSGGRARARRRATGLNGGQRRHGRQGPEPGPRARRPDEAYLPGLVLGGVRQPGGVERTTTLHSPWVFIDH
jgi:hypothetical protein